MKTTARLPAAAFLLAAAFVAHAAAAQEYPVKAIRIIVPLTPGSGADIAGRIVAKHMSDAFRQPVLVENRPGAGGIIGTQAMLNAEADGAQVNAIVQGKEVREQFGRIGIAAAPMKPEEFAKFVREQMGTFRKIAQEANIPQQ